MLLKPLALLTAAATAASAFIIVPELLPKDESIFKTLPMPTHAEPFSLPQDMLSQSIKLPCKRCRGRDTNFKLDFAVEDGTKLVLNGFELYPNADPWHGDLMASVTRASGRGRDKKLGYSLSVVPKAFDEDQKMELIDVVLRVIEVGHRFVDQIPIVKVGLIKAKTGEIIIGNIDIKESTELPCKSMICRTKAMLDDALKGVKGFGPCGRHKHRPHGPKLIEHPQHGIEEPEGHLHHGMRPYESGEHHSRGRLLRNIIAHVILPVLMGVTAGVGVAFLGMFICGVIYRLTTILRSRCRRARAAGCSRAKSVAPKYATAEEEKQRLMEADEAQETTLPPYTDDVEKK